MKRFKFLLMSFFSLAASAPSYSQGVDPRPVLGAIISAFQNCGPPNVYQMLSPQLFNVVGQQTNGSGCYAQIAAAGPVQNMQVVSQQNYPLGPMFIVRVAHVSFAVDWIIGFNQFTGKVEYLTFQSAQQPPVLPRVDPPTPGTPPSPGSTTPPPPSGGSPTTTSGSDGCDLYPTMCQ